MNSSAPEGERLGVEILNRSFDRAWAELEDEIRKIDFTSSMAKVDTTIATPSAKLDSVLDELLDITRSQLKVLKNPEELLPVKYLIYAMREGRLGRSFPRIVLDDLDRALRAMTGLVNFMDDPTEISPAQIRYFKNGLERLERVTSYFAQLDGEPDKRLSLDEQRTRRLIGSEFADLSSEIKNSNIADK